MSHSSTAEPEDTDLDFLGDDEREIVRMFVSYSPERELNDPLTFNMPPGHVDVVIYDPAKHPGVLETMVDLHSAVILQDHTLMTFLPPLNPATMLEWWKKLVSDPYRITFLAFAEETPGAGAELAGFVTLYQPFSQTGPFRCWVEKLVVSPRFRQRGIAKKLLARLEETALENGGTLMLLDTEAGSPAELVYPRLGYTESGRIPSYGISPKDGRRITEVFFYKHLVKPDEK